MSTTRVRLVFDTDNEQAAADSGATKGEARSEFVGRVPPPGEKPPHGDSNSWQEYITSVLHDDPKRVFGFMLYSEVDTNFVDFIAAGRKFVNDWSSKSCDILEFYPLSDEGCREVRRKFFRKPSEVTLPGLVLFEHLKSKQGSYFPCDKKSPAEITALFRSVLDDVNDAYSSRELATRHEVFERFKELHAKRRRAEFFRAPLNARVKDVVQLVIDLL